MDQDSDKDPARAPIEQVATPETALDPVETLPYRLGFEEDEPLRQAHEEVVAALKTGRSGPTREAWSRYVDLAEPKAEHDDPNATNRARTGITVTQATMYLEAGDIVKFLSYLLIADYAAWNEDWPDIHAVIDDALKSRGTLAEFRQAQGFSEASYGNNEAAAEKFEEALDIYVEGFNASDQEDTHRRGVFSLRMAECFRELLEIGLGDPAELQFLTYDTLQSAAFYLEDDTPERAKVEGAIDDLTPEQWWQDLVES